MRFLGSGLLSGMLLLITTGLFAPAMGAVPTNDAFTDALAVAALPYSNTQSTAEATVEAGEPLPCGDISATVWYSFAPSSASTVKVRTTALFDTVLAVYSGSSLPALDLIECNDDTGVLGSAVQFTASPGTAYRIQVGGFGGSTGDVTVDIETGVPPANDSFSNPQALPDPLPAVDSQNTVVATLEQGEPQPSCAPIGRTIWYVFTPGQTGLYRVRTEGSDFDTVLAVYTGSTIESLSSVDCNDDAPSSLTSELEFSGTAGSSYRIQVGGYQGDSGSLLVTFEDAADTGDADGDGVADIADNCPGVANPSQTNTDAALAAAGARQGVGNPPPPLPADGLGDACDADDDNDGFTDTVETAIGTNALDNCSVESGPGTGGDSWPLDNVINGFTNAIDVLTYKNKVPSAVDATHPKRLDIKDDAFLNVIDVLLYKGKVPSSCN